MAAAVYPKGKEAFFSGSINLSSDTIKVALIDTGTYTYSSSHQYYSSASAGAVGTPVALASKTITSGVFDAADTTITSVTGASIEAVIVYKDTGSTATSPLICFIDGLSLTPNGGDITVVWNASGIFAI